MIETNMLTSDEPIVPFALRFMEPARDAGDGKTATSKETRADGEEEADTDWEWDT